MTVLNNLRGIVAPLTLDERLAINTKLPLVVRANAYAATKIISGVLQWLLVVISVFSGAALLWAFPQNLFVSVSYAYPLLATILKTLELLKFESVWIV